MSRPTGIRVHFSSARVDADLVLCVDFCYYFSSGSTHKGAKTFRKSSGSLKNYPDQHLVNGRSKNNNTNTSFKKAVRILKRVENAMVEAGVHREVASHFFECLVFNCRDTIFKRFTWIEIVKRTIVNV